LAVFERDGAGNRGRQLWKNLRGRRVLTNYARNNPALDNWQDVVVHVPVTERQIGAVGRPYDPTPKDTYHPISEETVPGMMQVLLDSITDVHRAAFGPAVPVPDIELQDLTTLPTEFKDWVLENIMDADDNVIEQGSDRY
jgi:hypothetical protein